MNRKSRDRDKFEADEPLREARAAEIRRGLPQIAYVVGLFDPTWDPETAVPIRPSAKNGPGPPQGWTAAAMDLLREADRPLTIAEIVDQICGTYDLDLSTVALRQKRHTAINNSLMRTYRKIIISDDAEPLRWALRRKGLI